MAAPGSTLTTTVAVAELPEPVSQALVAAAAGDPGYTVNAAGTGTIILTRRYTPTWAIVVAVVGILFALIGLLALLYKVTETLTITIVPVDGGSRVSISGLATPEMATRIRASLNTMPALEGEPAAVSESGSAAATKVCPKCAEEVKAAATVCRFCGFEFETEAAAPAD
jgi:hypothetical protein